MSEPLVWKGLVTDSAQRFLADQNWLYDPGYLQPILAAIEAEAAAPAIARAEKAEAALAALALWHGGQLGRFGHRAGDHFDECVFCAVLHGSGFAYPTAPSGDEEARRGR